jgi:hypothetical protein
MKSKDIFCLIIRVFGLFFLYQGLAAVPVVVSSIWTGSMHLAFRNLVLSLLMVIWPIALAAWMLRGAPWLVRLAYSNDDRTA